MALTSSYLVSVKNVKQFFESLITAKAPGTFTQKFLEGLGFKSTNDRLFISVLKGLGFLDPNSVPTERYYRFLDQSESRKVLAEAVEEAYGDLFDVNTKAHELSVSEVKNKLRTLTQGKHSEKVVGLMASTFKALAEYAEWSARPAIASSQEKAVITSSQEQKEKVSGGKVAVFESEDEARNETGKTQFHYNIQVHLPESRDESVYDAIFKSLRRHLF